ncbi:MAG TPA: ANTAR domain-containing protein [Ideonella sp.]|uniref:ANTAR domain-containing protein n=1 Tax=Ideonella sp. TaxID=1929293 RepID=UPI002E306328|nr:ANTAR domain-containing protein [Ideonella sp.]HEX5682751.1 ANTAR domain-containing protein [Ideonella sp.]
MAFMAVSVILLSSSEVSDAVDAALARAQRALDQAGVPARRGGACSALVHQAGALAPDQVADQIVVVAPAGELAQALRPWAGEPPCAVSLLSEPLPEAERTELLALGLAGWWPREGLADDALAAGLALDHARWQREAAARHELARARGQLDERKWVDRAKGVLMSARGIGEDEAFRLLRGAAMHANLRVGEVSRSVIEASQWADAINRAGQLRMLSQRLVKLAAQRLAGIDARRARTLQDEATQRVQDNLDHLAALPQLAEAPESTRAALAAVNHTWTALAAALNQRQTPQALADSDQCAMALLACAEALTEALEEGGARRALTLVNLCGRQRMRVQRVAKDALLATLLGEAARRDALTPLLDEVEATLLELERAPLTSAESREALAAARDEWLRLLRGLRSTEGAQGSEGRALLARSSDALLDVFDRLTASYEHSLQVIMS